MQKLSYSEDALIQVPRLLTIDALASMLCVSRPTIYAFMRDGLPFIKLGRNLRFSLVSVQQWITEHEKAM